jgi:polyisoprenoid-binding protein YceI
VKMKFAMLAVLGAALLVLPHVVAADAYNLDGMHSMPAFTFKHLKLSAFRGRFEQIAGTIEFDPVQHNGRADITVSIDSVSTGVPMLDQFLKSAKFFDASRFPTATFQSKSFRFSGDQLVSVNGDLSLHGITKPVVLDVVDFSCREHPLLKVPSCGADARVMIKRSEFGLDAFTGNDSDEVEVDIAVEALKAQRP